MPTPSVNSSIFSSCCLTTDTKSVKEPKRICSCLNLLKLRSQHTCIQTSAVQFRYPSHNCCTKESLLPFADVSSPRLEGTPCMLAYRSFLFYLESATSKFLSKNLSGRYCLTLMLPPCFRTLSTANIQSL